MSAGVGTFFSSGRRAVRCPRLATSPRSCAASYSSASFAKGYRPDDPDPVDADAPPLELEADGLSRAMFALRFEFPAASALCSSWPAESSSCWTRLRLVDTPGIEGRFTKLPDVGD